MAMVVISGCEKEESIENLQLKDLYENGIVVYIDRQAPDEPIRWIEIMSLNDVGNFLSTEVPTKADEFRAENGPEWNIPNFGYLSHIIGVLDLQNESQYWYQNPDGSLHLIDADFGNNGLHPSKTDDGQPHLLRMHRIIYF